VSGGSGLDRTGRGRGTGDMTGAGAAEAVVEAGWTDPRFRAGLARAFPGWGGEAHSRFYLARDLGEGAPELVAIEHGDELVAAVAINYRRLRTADGGEARAGILTGGWTLPEARRRGRFRRLAAAAARRAAERGARWLLGFVTADNASARGMAALGSTLVPAWYCASGERTAGAEADSEAPPRSASWNALAEAFARDRLGTTAFGYRDTVAWRSQFVDRPDPVEAVRVGRARALIERAAGTDRLLLVCPGEAEAAVLPVLATRAHAAGRRFFCYVTDAGRRRAALAAGLTSRPGFVTVLPCPPPAAGGPPARPPQRWNLSAGDRM